MLRFSSKYEHFRAISTSVSSQKIFSARACGARANQSIYFKMRRSQKQSFVSRSFGAGSNVNNFAKTCRHLWLPTACVFCASCFYTRDIEFTHCSFIGNCTQDNEWCDKHFCHEIIWKAKSSPLILSASTIVPFCEHIRVNFAPSSIWEGQTKRFIRSDELESCRYGGCMQSYCF